MKKTIAIIETGRPLKDSHGGGSIKSMLILANYYESAGFEIILIFRHHTIVDLKSFSSNIKLIFLKNDTYRKLKYVRKDKKKKITMKSARYFKEIISSLFKFGETMKIFSILRKIDNLKSIHLNNRIVPNSHLIWLKPLLNVNLYQHQRQYDDFLLYPKFIYNLLISNIFCVSKDIQNNLASLGLRNINLLYNSCVSYKGSVKYRKQKKIKLIWIGRIIKWKGLHELSLLLKGSDVELQIYGLPDDKDQYFENTLNLLKEVDINFKYNEFVPSHEIFNGHHENTFLIHSSINPEPFGRVIIEAMSIGMIPISFGYGGASELISNGVDGYIIEPGKNIAHILFNNKTDWTMVSKNARDKFNDKFSSRIHQSKLNDFLCVE